MHFNFGIDFELRSGLEIHFNFGIDFVIEIKIDFDFRIEN